MFPLLIITFSIFFKCPTVLPLVVGLIIPQKIASQFLNFQMVHRSYDMPGYVVSIVTIFLTSKQCMSVLNIFRRKIFNIFTRYPEGMAHLMKSRGRPKLSPGVVPSLLSGFPSYYSSPLQLESNGLVLLRLQGGRFIEPSN